MQSPWEGHKLGKKASYCPWPDVFFIVCMIGLRRNCVSKVNWVYFLLKLIVETQVLNVTDARKLLDQNPIDFDGSDSKHVLILFIKQETVVFVSF